MTADVPQLLLTLEGISRHHPDRVLRLRGALPGADAGLEPFELLIFRGFSSSLSHPTGFDPDQPALPADAQISGAELLQGPYNPSSEVSLRGPLPAATFVDPASWR